MQRVSCFMTFSLVKGIARNSTRHGIPVDSLFRQCDKNKPNFAKNPFMPTMTIRPTVCAALLIFASSVFPQENASRRIRVLHITEPIKIDGRLDEPSWSQAEVATDFRQQEPNEGEPASEKTEVRLLFDDKNLYVGVNAFDSEPAR